MQLANFLESAREEILDAAVAFARTIPVLSTLAEHELRDHLPELLQTISADLRAPQSRTESIIKSHGDATPASFQTAAQTHGLIRAQLGLSIEQLVAEYRALRSSVLRLWADSHPEVPNTLGNVVRFNEAIDQAVAESVQFYADERERWRQIYLGVLGHDLRGPLNAITLTADLMRAEGSGRPAHLALLSQGVKRLGSLLDSLLEYSRTTMGVGMTLQREQVDLAPACADEIELLRAAHPDALIEYSTEGDTTGEFDASRIREALSNLVANAVAHGNTSGATSVRIAGNDAGVQVSVENGGDIAPEEFERLFEPLYRRDAQTSVVARTHLGLGLFITRQIARAHQGEVSVTCVEHRVRFTIELPKTFHSVSSAPG